MTSTTLVSDVKVARRDLAEIRPVQHRYAPVRALYRPAIDPPETRSTSTHSPPSRVLSVRWRNVIWALRTDVVLTALQHGHTPMRYPDGTERDWLATEKS